MNCRKCLTTTVYFGDGRVAARTVFVNGLAFSAAMLLSPAVFAQEEGSAKSQQVFLDEIVVTAQKREQSLQDVPISISAFSAADLRARGATSLSDLSVSTPNLTFNSSVVGQQVRIRGVGSNDVLSFFDPSVGIYVDGVYLPRMHGTDLDLVSVERVEVLRGPQGTLFGRNTIGGAISITTRKPSSTFQGSAELTTGSYDRLDTQISLEGPIVPDKLSGQIAAVVRNRDGYGIRRDFSSGEKIDEMGGQDRYGVRAAINWTPREDVDVSLSAGLSSTDEVGGYLNLLRTYQTALVVLSNAVSDPDYNDQYVTEPYNTYSTGPNASIEDTWGSALNVTWSLGSKTLRSITSYRSNEWDSQIDYDGSPLRLFEQDVSEDSTYFSQEFQLLGQTDRLDWVSGLYYGEEDSILRGPTYIFQTLYDSLGVDASTSLTNWNWNWNGAIYGQGTYKLTDQLSMTAGARYSYDDKKVGRQRQRLNTGVVNVPYAEVEDNWSAWSGRLGIEYSWTSDVMGYLSASRGYKSGGINGGSTTSADFLPFDPEYLVNYEVGLRSDWLDKRLRFNASVFVSKYTDMQFRALLFSEDAGTFVNAIGNIASSTIKGAELDFTVVPATGVLLSAGIGYIDASYDKVDPGSPISTNDDFVDTPKWSLTLTGEYTRPLQSGAQVTGRVDYSYRTEQYLTAINSPYLRQPAYAMVNARLAYTSPSRKWETAVFGSNLTDEQVMTMAWDLSAALNMLGQIGPPRQWGASVKYSF